MNAVNLPSRAKAVATREPCPKNALLGLLLLTVSGCASTGQMEIGMDEKAWRRTAADPVLMGEADTGEKVWKSGDAFYHFRDGKLARISGGEQQVQVTLGP